MTRDSAAVVSGVTYNAAGKMTALSYDGWTETRTFNALGQLTRITVPGEADWEYTFPTNGNRSPAASVSRCPPDTPRGQALR